MKIKKLRGSISVVAVLVIAACNQQQPQSKAPESSTNPAQLASVATNDIGKTPALQQTAMTLGKDIYEKNCGGCHGGDLKGSAENHTPDLTDDYWMFTGDDLNSGGLILFPSDVEKTVLYGIRSDHEKTRKDADMPGLGPQARKS
jgi:cytochrome c oxidase cbb3-type subunit 3